MLLLLLNGAVDEGPSVLKVALVHGLNHGSHCFHHKVFLLVMVFSSSSSSFFFLCECRHKQQCKYCNNKNAAQQLHPFLLSSFFFLLLGVCERVDFPFWAICVSVDHFLLTQRQHTDSQEGAKGSRSSEAERSNHGPHHEDDDAAASATAAGVQADVLMLPDGHDARRPRASKSGWKKYVKEKEGEVERERGGGEVERGREWSRERERGRGRGRERERERKREKGKGKEEGET